MSTNAELKLVVCSVCGREHKSKRNPNKAYKVWKGGSYCDDPDAGWTCYQDHVQTRVYKYGAGSAIYGGRDGVELAVDHMRKMNRLWNSLVEIDHFDRTEYRRLTANPILAQTEENLKTQLDRLLAAVQSQKVKQRKRKIQDMVLAADIKRVKAELKTTREALKHTRQQMAASNAALIEQLKLATEARIDKAVAEAKANGLLHTNYNKVLTNFKAASRKARKDGRMLRFHHFDGTGRINIDETNGLVVEEAYINAHDKQTGAPYQDTNKGNFLIGAARPLTTKTGIIKNNYATRRGNEIRDVRIRVTSGAMGVPVWLTIPTVFHRQLPEGSTIQNATVKLEKVGDKQRFNTNITVRVPKPASRFADVEQDGNQAAVAIDIGWRKVKGGIRIAYWADTSGQHGEWVLPDSTFSDQFEKMRDLQSIMKRRFNGIRDLLTPWLKMAQNVPDVVKQACSTFDKDTGVFTFSLHQWLSAQRMVHLLNVWEKNRFTGDYQMFQELRHWYYGDNNSRAAHKAWKGQETWSKARNTRYASKPDLYNGHKHLWLWEQHLSDQLQARRLDVYRCLAKSLATKYRQVFVEEFDLRAVAKKKSVESALVAHNPLRDVTGQQEDVSRRNRVIASVSTLRNAIENLCGREGLQLVQLDAAFTTKNCSVCGGMQRFNAAEQLVRSCDCDPNVPHYWDQDWNAARNVLDRGLMLADARIGLVTG